MLAVAPRAIEGETEIQVPSRKISSPPSFLPSDRHPVRPGAPLPAAGVLHGAAAARQQGHAHRRDGILRARGARAVERVLVRQVRRHRECGLGRHDGAHLAERGGDADAAQQDVHGQAAVFGQGQRSVHVLQQEQGGPAMMVIPETA